MDPEKRAKYEAQRTFTREEIDDIEAQIEQVLAEVKDRIESLNAEKEAQLAIYDGYCRLLGVPNDLSEDEEIA